MAQFINLTPHTLNIHTPEKVIDLAPSGEVARVAASSVEVAPIGGIPTVITEFGEVTGLPDPQEGVFLIVSGMVASAAPREDVLSPGEHVRDEENKIVGCKGLRRSR